MFFSSQRGVVGLQCFLKQEAYNRHITGAISVFNRFKTTGLMESGPAALRVSDLIIVLFKSFS